MEKSSRQDGKLILPDIRECISLASHSRNSMSEESKLESTLDYEKKEVMELVRRCGEGDRAALTDFFERFSKDIYNFPLKVFHLDEDAASEYYLYAY